MSKADIVAACAGKRGFPKKLDALIVATRPRRRRKVYRCPYCGQWHLSHVSRGFGHPVPPPPAIRDGLREMEAEWNV